MEDYELTENELNEVEVNTMFLVTLIAVDPLVIRSDEKRE